jgi:hypothetical protein
MSLFSMTPKSVVQEGLSRLKADLSSGEWQRRHPDLLLMDELDLGYWLLIADSPEDEAPRLEPAHV